MEIVYSHYNFKETGDIYFATNREEDNVYVEMIRKSYSLEWTVKYAIQNLSEGDKFIDIGANIGAIAIPIAKCGIHTLAIEALPNNYLLLLKTLQRNNLHNVVALQLAAHDCSEVVQMGGFGPWAYVSKNSTGIPVAAIRMDDVINVYQFGDAKIVKIDVEGAELAVLRGMHQFMRDNTDAEIIFESNSVTCGNSGYTTRDLLGEFERMGYNLFLFYPNCLIPRTSHDLQEECVADYLATRKSADEPFGDFVVRELDLEERIGIILRMATFPHFDHRQHIASALKDAPKEIVSDHRVKAAISKLVQDESEPVRDAACWVKDAFTS
jgi:FkbM family methyltransferase